MRSVQSSRAVVGLMTLAVVLAILAWVAQLTVGWFLPVVLVAAAVVLTVVALMLSRARMSR